MVSVVNSKFFLQRINIENQKVMFYLIYTNEINILDEGFCNGLIRIGGEIERMLLYSNSWEE